VTTPTCPPNYMRQKGWYLPLRRHMTVHNTRCSAWWHAIITVHCWTSVKVVTDVCIGYSGQIAWNVRIMHALWTNPLASAQLRSGLLAWSIDQVNTKSSVGALTDILLQWLRVRHWEMWPTVPSVRPSDIMRQSIFQLRAADFLCRKVQRSTTNSEVDEL